jgi:hypothetical protein
MTEDMGMHDVLSTKSTCISHDWGVKLVLTIFQVDEANFEQLMILPGVMRATNAV